MCKIIDTNKIIILYSIYFLLVWININQ